MRDVVEKVGIKLRCREQLWCDVVWCDKREGVCGSVRMGWVS